jgi:hypothetical protein
MLLTQCDTLLVRDNHDSPSAHLVPTLEQAFAWHLLGGLLPYVNMLGSAEE